MKKEIVKNILTLAALVSVIIGFHAYFAKASDLGLIAMRLEQKIAADAITQNESRRWQVLDRNKARDCQSITDDRDREDCRRIEQTIKELEIKNKLLLEKTIKEK